MYCLNLLDIENINNEQEHDHLDEFKLEKSAIFAVDGISLGDKAVFCFGNFGGILNILSID